MKRKNNQQEILLLATPGFSTIHMLCKTNGENNSGHLSILEQLEEACWSGLLHEMIPEIIQPSTFGKSLFIWQIHYGNTSLQIRLGEVPAAVEHVFSIDPQPHVHSKSHPHRKMCKPASFVKKDDPR